MLDRDSFGPYLRHARERRCVTLDDIAARTKISRSLLAKLERGDLSHWPPGIFRRSFFRAYVAAIGLDPDALIDDFLRLFPDPLAGPVPEREPTATDLRLTLDPAALRPRVSGAAVRRALVDTVVILSVAALISVLTGHAALVIATIAILYHGVSTATAGARIHRMHALQGAAASGDGQPDATVIAARTKIETRRGEGGRRPVRNPRFAVDSNVVRNVVRPS